MTGKCPGASHQFRLGLRVGVAHAEIESSPLGQGRSINDLTLITNSACRIVLILFSWLHAVPSR